MSEYKLLKDFDEIVPGMVFEMFPSNSSNPNSNLHIDYVGIDKGCVVIGVPVGGDRFVSKVISYYGQYKLIHDPRKKNEMTIQEKIDEHKKQIEILEKELEIESLNNLFVKDKIYKIKMKDSEPFLCKYYSSTVNTTNPGIFVYRTDNKNIIVWLSSIEKVWLIENLNDMFYSNAKIFERKF